MKSVLVVGAGFAGLSTALEIARSGMRVTVLEARDAAGGRAQCFTTPEGFTFDAGPTLIVMTDALRTSLGDRTYADLKLHRLEPGYRIFWPDGEHFDLSSNVARFLDEIVRFEGFYSRARALDYLAKVHEQYTRARKQILEVDHTFASFVRTLAHPAKFAPWSLGRLLPFLRKHFRNDRTVQALSFQTLYLGTSPLRAPAMYALLAVEEIVGGVWATRGGTGAIVNALVRECQRAGVKFRFRTAVRRVLTTGRRATAVICEDGGRIDADGVAITSDREPSMASMFPGAPRTLRTTRYGHSAIVWYAGIRGNVALPHHSVFLPADPWRAYAQLDAATIPDEPLVYVSNAAASDPGIAPAGDSSLLMLAPVPNAKALCAFDEQALFDRAIARVEQHAGPLRERIACLRVRAPRHFACELGLAHGAAFGPDHTLDQMGPLRPSIRHPRFENVVFAGSGTHPGSGVPMVLISGKLAAQRLAEALQ